MTSSPWHQRIITVEGRGRGLYDITQRIQHVVREAGIVFGLCHVFLQHTSASLLIQENADPDVLADLGDWFARHAPDGDPRYRHTAEGPDDMSAHIRAALTQTSLTIPLTDAELALGTWQGIYLFEHRTGQHGRRLVVTVNGSTARDANR